VLWIVIAYFFHQSIVDAVTGGEDVTRKQQPRLYNLLENLCISRGLPMPKLKLIDSDALNAYATGLNQRQYAVTVTSGLLKALNDQEIEAVLGHELTHIRNGDVQLMVIAVIIAGAVGFFAELFFRSFTNFGWSYGGRRSSWSSSSSSSSDRDNRGSGGGAVVVIIIAVALIGWRGCCRRWCGWRCRVARVSRRRRIGRADKESRRHDLGAAQDREPRRTSRRYLRGNGIMPRQSARGLCRPVCDHPSVDSRVQALVKFAGGHDPGDWLCRRIWSRAISRSGGRRSNSAAAALRPWGDANDPDGASRGPRKAHLKVQLKVHLKVLGQSRGPWGRH